MNATTQRILAEAMNLPADERAALAAALLGSLDSDCDPDAETAWGAEIMNRAQELDSGAVKPVAWSEARRQIHGRLNGPSAS